MVENSESCNGSVQMVETKLVCQQTSSNTLFDLQQQPSAATCSRSASVSSDGDKTEKLLKVLQFRNPGPQLSGFNPDRSRREQRKVNQFVEKTLQKKEHTSRRADRNGAAGTKRRKRTPPSKQARHDRSGVRLSDGKDVCDCQDLNCPGCHFPCSACGSEKCGVECRCSRKWTYIDVEVENPYQRCKT
ncbi:ARL14 effector protein-like [Nematostella vectensis]|uniref:ARL14 effector protein-like n=1 Tax=Nematostella vectensis TaxID=45351 RepID=UPI0013905771|nr:ARL14 effector protein-like [Nematostella vectensis]